MKRHSSLAPLSRDHHHALVIARRLRKATDETAADEAQRLLEHWEAELRAHFLAEEEVLLPTYAAHGSPDHPLIARALLDHLLIRRDIARIARELALKRAELDLLHQLGARLQAHVRIEERQLFPLIERAIPEEELRPLGEALDEAERLAPLIVRARAAIGSSRGSSPWAERL
jgi:iron-sulfur cluster repair protein YtfE (RIC family)